MLQRMCQMVQPCKRITYDVVYYNLQERKGCGVFLSIEKYAYNMILSTEKYYSNNNFL